ncbi:MAG: hypothetical protein J6333_01735 [Planctomycetes bacterium]|nr:hypothetical protein [Planctomycetota bacterium]
MDDTDYYLRRRTEALERQNYALERQNALTELQNRINVAAIELQGEQLRVTRVAAQAQMLQNARMIDTMERQVAATQNAADASWEVVNATREVADVIERGQRAWAQVELAKMERLQKKDAIEEFTHEQEHNIYALWKRMPELKTPPSTPGGKFMLWEEMRAARADIAIDAVHDIEYLDRDHEVGTKLRDFIVPLVNQYPLLTVVAADYPGQITLAKKLQKQTFFRTFADNDSASILQALREQFPELNIPDCATFPQKSFNFVQDVSRLKNLCALLGETVAKDPKTQAIVMAASNLDSTIFSEEKWSAIGPTELSPLEASYYFRFYRNPKVLYDDATSADALQRVLEPLASFLKLDIDPVEQLRRIERNKREEVAKINEEIQNIAEAKRRAEKDKRRAEKEEEQERLRKEEEKRRRAEEERENQRRQQMKDGVVDALFKLLRNHHGGIKPCIQSKNAIKFDNRLLGCSKDTFIFGNRVEWCDFTNKKEEIICTVHIWTWKALAKRNGKFFHDERDAFVTEFRKAEEILPNVDGMNDCRTIVTKTERIGCVPLGCLSGIFLGLITYMLPKFFLYCACVITITIIICFYHWWGERIMFERKIQKILRDSLTLASIYRNLWSPISESITGENSNKNNNDDGDDDDFDNNDE